MEGTSLLLGLSMANYPFSAVQRWAVFQVHGARCYLNSEPIDLKSLQIDHIVPEHLLEKPDILAGMLKELGLPSDFDLNSYENWLPACGPCNGQKRGRVFKPVPIHLASLDRAKAGADRCRQIEEAAIRKADVAKALNYLERAAEKDELEVDQLKPLILAFAESNRAAMRALLEDNKSLTTDFTLGLQVVPEFAIAPNFKVLYTAGAIRIVQTPHGVGYEPADPNPHHSFYCGHCGSKGPWNGTRCLSCGMMDDGD